MDTVLSALSISELGSTTGGTKSNNRNKTLNENQDVNRQIHDGKQKGKKLKSKNRNKTLNENQDANRQTHNGKPKGKKQECQALLNVEQGGVAAARVSSKTETHNSMNNTDGLKAVAEQWLKQASLGAECADDHHGYKFFECSNNGEVPPEHWTKAYKEFFNRFYSAEADNNNDAPSVLLVATGVDEDWWHEIAAGEELHKGKYLFFPELQYGENKTSALFITYIPGPPHGEADVYVMGEFRAWRKNSAFLRSALATSANAGSYGCPMPDGRIYPKWKHRDHNQNENDPDVDKKNGNCPHSRLIWEFEWKHRNPVELRQNGYRLMTRSKYNRVYLAGTMFGIEGNDKMQAAIVMWEKEEDKNGASNIKVTQAFDFGNMPLSDANKQKFAEERSNVLALEPVKTDQWVRPEEADNDGYPNTLLPVFDPRAGKSQEAEHTLMMQIPCKQILYKVSYGDDENNEYATEHFSLKDHLNDCNIDLAEFFGEILDCANNEGTRRGVKRKRGGSDSSNDSEEHEHEHE